MRKIFLALLTAIPLTACSNDKLANEILDAYWDKRKPCIKTFSKFPFTMDERYYSEYAPLLDELEKFGYVTHTEKKVNINHSPQKEDVWVNARAYSLTEKGEVLRSSTNQLCYGRFETVNAQVEDEGAIRGVEIKTIAFKFQITDVADWATENKELIYLSDSLFDDLSTLEKPADGKIRITRKDGKEWRRRKTQLYFDPPSKDPKNERNVKIRQRLAEADYQALLWHEENGTEEHRLKSYYEVFRHRHMDSEHYNEVDEKYLALSSKMLKAQNDKREADTELFQKLAQDFATAIDAKDASKIASLTVSGTAANRAHTNNAFKRNKVGDLSLKSFKFSGSDNELVQMQLDGNIYMLRAKMVDGAWAINGYSAKSGL
ncbi:MAG: hypothetical protein R3183_10995 [Oleiphilaceae bacterium]|nr:hypothetical protein [Oleiphilaceae bacterium]